MWTPCVSGAEYMIGVDWDRDGSFSGLDNLTEDVLDRGITSFYGRDQARQLSPASVGNAAFDVCNVSRIFSPENTSSPLFENLQPARPVRIEVLHGGVTYEVHTGRIDDFNIRADFSDRSVSFTSLDGLALLQNSFLSTEVHEAERTGTLVNVILDAVGWVANRSIDVGATHVPWWWEEGTDAFTALQKLVLSEGPPAIAYVAPDGTFVFRDRHHRIQDETSLVSQALFNADAVSCETPIVTGFSYTAPFEYEHGWRDIINHVSQEVEVRTVENMLTVVWRDEGTYMVTDGETLSLSALSSGPFMISTEDPPIIVFDSISGPGVQSISISRFSGQSVTVNITAVGGSITFSGISLRAKALSVSERSKVDEEDSTSIQNFGDKYYPNDLPWVNKEDAEALAQIILANYAERRPLVHMRVSACDPEHLLQVLTRTISDRITIRNGELGLFSDFFIESVKHDIRRINTESGPVHAVTLGCERALEPIRNCFTFDVAGLGFDQGVFCGEGIDDPETVFIFDHPQNGQFDFGVFGT